MGDPSAMPDVLAELGPRLRRLRERRGITLTALAAKTGISKSTLSRLETGQRKPSLELLPVRQRSIVEQGATRSDPADVVAPMGAYLNCVDEWSEGVVRSAQRPFRTRRHRCPLEADAAAAARLARQPRRADLDTLAGPA